MVLGDEGSGKTSLIKRFAPEKTADYAKPRIGVPIYATIFKTDDKTREVIIWECEKGYGPGDPMCKKFSEEASGIILIFDLADQNTFDSLDTWIEEIKNCIGSIPIVLVGNKKDLEEERKIKNEAGQSKAKQLDTPYMEASASTGENVPEMFTRLISLIESK